MKLICVWVVAMLAACSTEGSGPDAALAFTVHDIAGPNPCDVAWSATGYGPPPRLCERACEIRPVDVPCPPGKPCNDHPGCAVALNGYEAMRCEATFTATDTAGQHLGCCLMRADAGGAEAMPSFFECR